jgi:hypothetical protein
MTTTTGGSAVSVGNFTNALWATEMQPFRRDRRFQDVVARFGYLEYWRQYGPPDGYVLGPGDELVEQE